MVAETPMEPQAVVAPDRAAELRVLAVLAWNGAQKALAAAVPEPGATRRPMAGRAVCTAVAVGLETTKTEHWAATALRGS